MAQPRLQDNGKSSLGMKINKAGGWGGGAVSVREIMSNKKTIPVTGQ